MRSNHNALILRAKCATRLRGIPSVRQNVNSSVVSGRNDRCTERRALDFPVGRLEEYVIVDHKSWLTADGLAERKRTVQLLQVCLTINRVPVGAPVNVVLAKCLIVDAISSIAARVAAS